MVKMTVSEQLRSTNKANPKNVPSPVTMGDQSKMTGFEFGDRIYVPHWRHNAQHAHMNEGLLG